MAAKDHSYVGWWLFTTVISLASLGLAIFVGWATGKPIYRSVLRDGAYYIFAAVLVADSLGNFFYALTKKKPRGNRVRLSANWNLVTLLTGLLCGGGTVALYTATLMAKYGGPSIRESVQPALATLAMTLAIFYSLGCARLRYEL